MGFKHINSSILLTPIWKESPEIIKLWVTLLLIKDTSNAAYCSRSDLFEYSKLQLPEFSRAMDYLTSTNPPMVITTKNGYLINKDFNNKKIKNEIPLWRKNTEEGFNAYLVMVDREFTKINNDIEWLIKMKKIYPNAKIGESLEKSYLAFWGNEKGWHNKKSKKTNYINWQQTIENTLPINMVFLKKNEEDYEKIYIAKYKANKCLNKIQ